MQAPRGIDPTPLAHPSRSRPGLAWALLSLITLAAVVSMAVFFFQRQDLSTRLAASERRLGEATAELSAGARSIRALQGQLRGLGEDLAVTVRTVDRCRASLRAMVQLWNRHIEELEAAEAGIPATIAAAHERTEAARDQAERSLRQCQGVR